MKYNTDSIIKEIDNGKQQKFLFFWGHQKNKNGIVTSSCFSQWYEIPFVVDGVTFHSAEHWMMAQKALLFGDNQTYEKIIRAQSPAEAKKLGREVTGFDDHLWVKKRFEIVVTGNTHKFSQHAALAGFLLNTNDQVLVEASPVDPIWGIGMAVDNKNVNDPACWKGLNLLGFALMEVRDRLKLNL